MSETTYAQDTYGGERGDPGKPPTRKPKSPEKGSPESTRTTKSDNTQMQGQGPLKQKPRPEGGLRPRAERDQKGARRGSSDPFRIRHHHVSSWYVRLGQVPGEPAR